MLTSNHTLNVVTRNINIRKGDNRKRQQAAIEMSKAEHSRSSHRAKLIREQVGPKVTINSFHF